MSARAAQCPSCGGEVLFRAGTSLVTVCTHCRAAVARKGAALESLGKVAELVPTSSPFQVGMTGKPRRAGLRPFTIAGRLQLSYGQGAWDEWYLAFDDGRYGWLAEAQGQFWLTRAMPAPTHPPPPEFSQLQPGQALQLSPYGAFTVTDRRQALYVSAEGDLPFRAPPGSVFVYADLSGADGTVATLDYGDDPGVDAFFVGEQVELDELRIEGLVGWSERKSSTKASSLNCPSCGGGIELKDPATTVRVACPYCGSLLGADSGSGGASSKFAILDALREAPFRPAIPLGSAGSLLGLSYVVLGCVLKSSESEGTTYFWREYLLKETKSEAYHWLAESAGHWTLLAPVAAGEVSVDSRGRVATFAGRRYSLYSRATAKVEAVLGEFYWEVARGELTQAADYVDPPRMLSSEQTGEEIAWTEGTYLDPAFVEEGFALPERLEVPEGVGANQPWPKRAEAKAVTRASGILLGILLLLFLFFQVTGPRTVVFQRSLSLAPFSAMNDFVPPGKVEEFSPVSPGAAGPAVPPAEEHVYVSEAFDLPRSGNVEARIYAPTDNTWIALGAALINETTGETREFSLLSDYFHGTDGGESWEEGTRGRAVFLSRVPKGRYVLRLEPELEAGKAPPFAEVRLRAGVPGVLRFFLAAGLLLLGPLWALFSFLSYDSRRREGSDFAGGEPNETDPGDSSSPDE